MVGDLFTDLGVGLQQGTSFGECLIVLDGGFQELTGT
jgi:hypothetical protein